MDEMTFNILKIVISVVSALVGAYLVPYIKTKTRDARYEKLLDIVEVAVRAAEQTMTGEKQGKAKKQEVTAFVTEWMENRGIQIAQEELSQLIEAAVYGIKQEG